MRIGPAWGAGSIKRLEGDPTTAATYPLPHDNRQASKRDTLPNRSSRTTSPRKDYSWAWGLTNRCICRQRALKYHTTQPPPDYTDRVLQVSIYLSLADLLALYRVNQGFRRVLGTMSEHAWHQARLAVGLDLARPLGASSARIASFLLELSCRVSLKLIGC